MHLCVFRCGTTLGELLGLMKLRAKIEDTKIELGEFGEPKYLRQVIRNLSRHGG